MQGTNNLTDDDLRNMTVEELVAIVRDQEKLIVRGSRSVCPTCRKWATYTGIYDADGNTLRCYGCLKAVGKCICSGVIG